MSIEKKDLNVGSDVTINDVQVEKLQIENNKEFSNNSVNISSTEDNLANNVQMIDIYYYLSMEGQKKAILAGDSGKQKRCIQLPINEELLDLSLVDKDGNAFIEIEKEEKQFDQIQNSENIYNYLNEKKSDFNGLFTANISEDNDSKKEDSIAIEKMFFDKTSICIKESEFYDLVLITIPNNSDKNNIIWTTSDDRIITVNNEGKVFGNSAGYAKITAKTLDGRISDSCEVRVTSGLDNIQNSVHKKSNSDSISNTNSSQYNTNMIVYNSTDKSGYAVASLVLSLIGIIAWIIPLFGFPINILACVFGIISIKSKKKRIAIAGLIISILFLIATIINSSIGAYKGAKGELFNFLSYDNSSGDDKILSDFSEDTDKYSYAPEYISDFSVEYKDDKYMVYFGFKDVDYKYVKYNGVAEIKIENENGENVYTKDFMVDESMFGSYTKTLSGDKEYILCEIGIPISEIKKGKTESGIFFLDFNNNVTRTRYNQLKTNCYDLPVLTGSDLAQISYDESFTINKYYSSGRLWYTTRINSFEITNIEMSYSDKLNVTYRVSGVVSGSDYCSFTAKCYDAGGFVIGTGSIIKKVSEGETFRFTDSFYIPDGTVRIEFVDD